MTNENTLMPNECLNCHYGFVLKDGKCHPDHGACDTNNPNHLNCEECDGERCVKCSDDFVIEDDKCVSETHKWECNKDECTWCVKNIRDEDVCESCDKHGYEW